MVTPRHKPNNEVEPYPEPDPENNEWPSEWTPRQRQNWIDSGSLVYNELETDEGRYWYRRTWRPKKRKEGMMEREHVKIGQPEDYIVENVADHLNPMGDMTSVMMRQLSRYSVEKDVLDDVVRDIVHAKVANMSDRRKGQLLSDANRVAKIYGLD